MDNSDFRNDPQHRADYEQARLLLNQPPHLWFADYEKLPPLSMRAVASVKHEFDSTRLFDVLSRIRIQRTVNPQIKDVYFNGAFVGRIARHPYGIAWAAECDKRVLFYSKTDAALRTVAGVLHE